jgi:hypothetical protein
MSFMFSTFNIADGSGTYAGNHGINLGNGLTLLKTAGYTEIMVFSFNVSA